MPLARILIITCALWLPQILLPATAALAQADANTKITTYTGTDRQSVLEAGARREGSLTLYTTGTTTGPTLELFQKKYPFVKLNVARADSVDITRKTMEEYGAGYYDVDVFDLSTNGLIPLRAQDILQPFVSPEMAALLPASIEPNHYWASDRLTYTGIGFNTDAISPAEAPKTYRDMLDPKWKGRMAISGLAGTAANWVGAMLLSEGEDYVRALGRQEIQVYPITARAVANLMISGEIKISPDSYYDHITSSKEGGAPLAWVAPGPVPVLDTAVAIASRAPHPNAALLFVDFMLSRDGQKMFTDLHYLSPRSDMPKADQPEFEKLFVANRPHYTEEFESWNKLLNDVFLHPAQKH